MLNEILFDLTLTAMPAGGYVVTRMPPVGSGYMTVPMFASTEVDDALAFMKSKIGKPAVELETARG